MNGSSRTRALVRWLAAVGAMTLLAMGTAAALHHGAPADEQERLQPFGGSAATTVPGLNAGGSIDHSAVERLAPDAAEQQPMLSVAAYGA